MVFTYMVVMSRRLRWGGEIADAANWESGPPGDSQATLRCPMRTGIRFAGAALILLQSVKTNHTIFTWL